jgi:hypothetical protein
VTDIESLLLGPVAQARFARGYELPHLDTTRTQRRKQGMEPPVEAPPTACSARGRGPAEARGFRGEAWRGSRARHGGRSVAFLAGGCGRNSQRPLSTGGLSRELAEDLQFLGSFVAAEAARLPRNRCAGARSFSSWARLFPRLRRGRVVVVVVYEGLNRLVGDAAVTTLTLDVCAKTERGPGIKWEAASEFSITPTSQACGSSWPLNGLHAL